MQNDPFPVITVRRAAGVRAAAGSWQACWRYQWRLGAAGIKANKREGDGGTPRGTFRLRQLWWRADQHPRPTTSLAGAADRTCRWLVRGPGRPAIQPADQGARRMSFGRSTDAQRQSLRFHHRDRSQHAAARCRTRQCGLHPRGTERASLRPPAASPSNSTTLRRMLSRLGPRTRIVVE